MHAITNVTTAQAWAIASVLNQASMNVDVIDIGRPFFRGCSGGQFMAAVLRLVNEGGSIGEDLAGMDWLTVSFEEVPGPAGQTGFTSLELGWSR